MDVRLTIMPAVADYKRRYNLSIEDRQQEQAVLDRVAMQAHALGINEDKVQNIFRVQIELAKDVQRVILKNSTDSKAIPSWSRELDLTTDLRPALAELNDRIVHELARASSGLHDRILLRRLANEEITISGISLAGKRQLADALGAVGREEKSKRIKGKEE